MKCPICRSLNTEFNSNYPVDTYRCKDCLYDFDVEPTYFKAND